MGYLQRLEYNVLRHAHPSCANRIVTKGAPVTVHATGSILVENMQKRMFWTTREEGQQQPFTFQAGIGNVIQGWDQGVIGMALGEVREIFIPSQFGYGNGGFPAWQIPPDADLHFEVEVLQIG